MKKRVLIPMVDGFEEIEAVSTIDILRRAGLDVVTAGIGTRKVTGSHSITIEADALFDDVKNDLYDMIAVPGGPGTRTLLGHEGLLTLLRAQAAAGKWVAAICAAPTVLARAGLLERKKATCFPGCEEDMAGALLCKEEVAVDGMVITSRGAGTAIPFALRIVQELMGEAKAADLKEKIVFRSRET